MPQRLSIKSKSFIAKWLMMVSLLLSMFTFSASGIELQSYQKEVAQTTIIISRAKDAKRVAHYKNIYSYYSADKQSYKLDIREFEICFANSIKTILRRNAKQIFQSSRETMRIKIKFSIRNMEIDSISFLRG